MIPKHTRRDLLFGLLKQPVTKPGVQAARMLAVIQPFDCLAARGQVCTVCLEHCPVPGTIRIEGRRVTIAATSCTGCGACQTACPAPQNAIVLWPAQLAT